MQLSLVFTILVAFTAFTLASPIPQLGFYERACEIFTLVRMILICHAVSAEHGELESNLVRGYEVDSVGGSNYAHERGKLSYT
jgi:hypothetical protein